MGVTIVFLVSLAGIIGMIGLKLMELEKGFRPFRFLNQALDGVLRSFFEKIGYYLRFLNRKTFYLLLLFLMHEGSNLAKKGWARFKETKMFTRFFKRNWGIESGGESTPASRFLEDVSLYKSDGKKQ